MRLNLLRMCLCIAAVALGAFACSEDEKVMEEVVKVEEDKHEFDVDKENGKVEFKAEIVYFAFDDHTLTDAGIERLTALANYMKQNPALRLKIQGHCDQRGSVEYNLALGKRRADSVASYLQSVGIAQARLDSISFGEEKLANTGNDEASWAENRRADFTFVNFDKATAEAKTQKSADPGSDAMKKEEGKLAHGEEASSQDSQEDVGTEELARETEQEIAEKEKGLPFKTPKKVEDVSEESPATPVSLEE